MHCTTYTHAMHHIWKWPNRAEKNATFFYTDLRIWESWYEDQCDNFRGKPRQKEKQRERETLSPERAEEKSEK